MKRGILKISLGKRAVRGTLIHIAIIVAFALYAFILKCPAREWLGLCCPGCGLTRACLAALRLDMVSALHYHPLFWLFPPYIFLYMHRRAFRLPFRERVWHVGLTVVCVLMIVQYAVRLFTGSDVVYIDPQRGYLFKLFDAIR